MTGRLLRIKEHCRTRADYRDIALVDTIPGIVAPGSMTALVIFAFQSSPVDLIVIARSLTVLIAPMLGVLIAIMWHSSRTKRP